MEAYEPHCIMAIVTPGRKQGAAQFPFTTISGRIAGLIKSKYLFVGKTRRQLGLEPHIVDD